MNVFGVDVYEGTGTVDWGAVKSSQATFGICKATEYHKDSRFDRNWQDIKSAGLDGRGAYHFLLTNRDVGGQAKMFVDTVGPLGPGDFGPIVDYEPDPDNGGAIPSAAQMAAYVDHLLQAYPDRRPIIYGNAGDLAGLGSQFVGSCDLWIAHYGPNNGHPPNIQPPTAAWPTRCRRARRGGLLRARKPLPGWCQRTGVLHRPQSRANPAERTGWVRHHRHPWKQLQLPHLKQLLQA